MPIHKMYSIVLVAGLFVLSSLACSVGRFLPDQRVETPQRSVEVNADAAAEAEQLVADSQAEGTIRMTETQFNSLLNTQLNQQGDAPLQDVTVWFEPGTVVVEGQLQEGILPMTGASGARLVMSGELMAEDGNVSLSVNEASVGGVKVPGTAIDLLNDRIESALSSSAINTAQIRSITVESGAIVIVRE